MMVAHPGKERRLCGAGRLIRRLAGGNTDDASKYDKDAGAL
jgi:hypothetical protein